MDDSTKLPDIKRLRLLRLLPKTLPPQSSALDTSNWEGRNVSAPIIDLDRKRKSYRPVDFLKAKQEEPFGLTENQLKKLLKEQGFSSEQIQQKLYEANNANKSSK